MCLFCAPLYFTRVHVCVCVRVLEKTTSSPELLLPALQAVASLLSVHFFVILGSGQLCYRFPLSDSSHGCPFSCSVVSACVVTGTQSKKYVGGEASIWHRCEWANELLKILLLLWCKFVSQVCTQWVNT